MQTLLPEEAGAEAEAVPDWDTSTFLLEVDLIEVCGEFLPCVDVQIVNQLRVVNSVLPPPLGTGLGFLCHENLPSGGWGGLMSPQGPLPLVVCVHGFSPLWLSWCWTRFKFSLKLFSVLRAFYQVFIPRVSSDTERYAWLWVNLYTYSFSSEENLYKTWKSGKRIKGNWFSEHRPSFKC